MTIERRTAVTTNPVTGHQEYSLQTGRWPWSRRSVSVLNDMGFADDEFPDAASVGGCVRILLAGDSFAFGDGVDSDSSFATIMERESGTYSAQCVRVVNIGVRGTSIEHQSRRIRQALDFVHPDIVILQQYQNDLTDLLEPKWPDDTTLSAIVSVATRSASAVVGANLAAGAPESDGWASLRNRAKVFRPSLVRLLSYHSVAWMITHGIHRDALHHWSVLANPSQAPQADALIQRYATSFDSLATFLNHRGVSFGVIPFPSKIDLLAGRFLEEKVFLRLAEKHRVPAMRIFPLLDKRRSPYTFLMYDGHLNEHGNRLVATAILEWLFDSTPAPFPILRGIE